mgnify:CR=1 FL=1
MEKNVPGYPPSKRCATCFRAASKVCACGVTWFCSRECQKKLFPSHKAKCRLWRQLDDATIDAAVDRVLATSHTTIPEVEPGSTCWVCLEADGVVWAGCGCRGQAAAIHVECAVKLARSKGFGSVEW